MHSWCESTVPSLEKTGSLENGVGDVAQRACSLNAAKLSFLAMRNKTVRMVSKRPYPRALRFAAWKQAVESLDETALTRQTPPLKSQKRQKATGMTNTGYRALLAQREALEKQIEELKLAERGDAIDWIREQLAFFDMKPEDLAERRGRGPRKRSGPVAAEYRDPASEKAWSGRGRAPLWLADQDRANFAIFE
jgi:DNA-binding protein H-NS